MAKEVTIKSELTQEIETRLQLVLTISIFFPSLMQIYFNALGHSGEQYNNVLLNWSTPVVFYLSSYLIFAVRNKLKSSARLFGAINDFLLLPVACYILPALVLSAGTKASLGTGWLGWTNYYVLQASMWLLPVVAMLTIFLFIINTAWSHFSKKK